jgi:intein/homing endonuclease
MKRLSWKYIAGLFDGEGCLDIQVSKQNYITPRVRMAMAEPGLGVLEMLSNTYGGNIYKRNRSSKNSDWMDAYSWEITSYKRCCYFLRQIVKHLEIKKEQARLILWCETHLKGMNYGKDEDPESLSQIRKFVRQEMSAMKRDPHRLSETAQDNILEMLQSS